MKIVSTSRRLEFSGHAQLVYRGVERRLRKGSFIHVMALEWCISQQREVLFGEFKVLQKLESSVVMPPDHDTSRLDAHRVDGRLRLQIYNEERRERDSSALDNEGSDISDGKWALKMMTLPGNSL